MEEQQGRTESEPQDVLTEANYVEIPKKSAKKRNGSSVSAFTQTYPSKLEIHQEELLKAFKSMETQLLKIVEQSYADQIDNDKTYLEKENIWLKDRIKDLEELLKTEKKEKERLQQEKCASIRKMLESIRKDLQYTSERLEMSQKESLKLQEKLHSYRKRKKNSTMR